MVWWQDQSATVGSNSATDGVRSSCCIILDLRFGQDLVSEVVVGKEAGRVARQGQAPDMVRPAELRDPLGRNVDPCFPIMRALYARTPSMTIAYSLQTTPYLT